MSSQGSAIAETYDICLQRDRRATQLRADGRQVVGYFCCHPPVELLTALDLIPFRIQGNVDRPVTMADAYLEPICCSYMRSCFDLALAGWYDFLDGIIIPHTCDTVQKIHDIWRYHRKPKLAHFLNVPHMVQLQSYAFFKEELLRLKTALEEFAGKEMRPEALRHAVALHNHSRALLRQIYSTRQAALPPIAGSEVVELIVAGMGMPVNKYNELLRRVSAELAERVTQESTGPRVMIVGSEIDDPSFVKIVEDAGAQVVVDDLCTGTRSFWADVPITDDPFDGLADRYLGKINCPRTYRPQQRPRAKDLENRFGYLKSFARDFQVDGVILYVIRFCDTYELDAPDIVEFFKNLQLPVLHMEEEYRVANVGQIKTRVEAFVESL